MVHWGVVILVACSVTVNGKRFKREWPSGSTGWEDDGTLSPYQTYYPEMSPYGYTADETYYPGQSAYRSTFDDEDDTFTKQRGRRESDDNEFGGGFATDDVGFDAQDNELVNEEWSQWFDNTDTDEDKFTVNRQRRNDWTSAYYDEEVDKTVDYPTFSEDYTPERSESFVASETPSAPESPAVPEKPVVPETPGGTENKVDMDDTTYGSGGPELVESVQTPNQPKIAVLDENGKTNSFEPFNPSGNKKTLFDEKLEYKNAISKSRSESGSEKNSTPRTPTIIHIEENILPNKPRSQSTESGNHGPAKITPWRNNNSQRKFGTNQRSERKSFRSSTQFRHRRSIPFQGQPFSHADTHPTRVSSLNNDGVHFSQPRVNRILRRAFPNPHFHIRRQRLRDQEMRRQANEHVKKQSENNSVLRKRFDHPRF